MTCRGRAHFYHNEGVHLVHPFYRTPLPSQTPKATHLFKEFHSLTCCSNRSQPPGGTRCETCFTWVFFRAAKKKTPPEVTKYCCLSLKSNACEKMKFVLLGQVRSVSLGDRFCFSSEFQVEGKGGIPAGGPHPPSWRQMNLRRKFQMENSPTSALLRPV